MPKARNGNISYAAVMFPNKLKPVQIQKSYAPVMFPSKLKPVQIQKK